MGKGGQIWLKCITVDLIMIVRYKVQEKSCRFGMELPKSEIVDGPFFSKSAWSENIEQVWLERSQSTEVQFA